MLAKENACAYYHVCRLHFRRPSEMEFFFCVIFTACMKNLKYLLPILGVLGLFSCVIPSKGNRDGKRPAFEPIAGTDFYETRRAFDNGLSFDTIGFQQEPLWHINFTNDDSVKIHSLKGDS